MCLTLTDEFETLAKANKAKRGYKIATRNIPVFKAIQGSGHAPYFPSVEYVKGYHYYQDGSRPFSFEVKEETKLFTSKKLYRLHVLRGLHSTKTEWRALTHADRVVKMVIPKGAKYFENANEYVSDQLIWR